MFEWLWPRQRLVISPPKLADSPTWKTTTTTYVREVWQLRACGQGLSVNADVLRVDDQAYLSQEEAEEHADEFRRKVTRLHPGRYDAIRAEECIVTAYRLVIGPR